ncbi:unnamed protein product [Acanthosepion pharaonis]|uniref:RNA polymerase II nuclear localization protein SLC7A6OS n=1 Tax=Acanthosepion pharaonis TaxID=158019 RepID=A0A812E4F5_ACAPH|nr:unnamed protein product [Sepia pharaonis]
MAAIVRLKRRITDEPLEKILVSCCKKQKCENGSEKQSENLEENITTQVLKFAGTVPDKNEEISKHIKNAIRKEKLAKEYKRHINCDISAQNRVIKKISSNKNRYNIVSQFRAKQLDKIDEIVDEEAEANKKDDKTKEAEGSEKSEKLFCLYDMEQEYITQNQSPEEEIVTCNSVPMIKEKVTLPMNDADKTYVYDLYYINQPHFNYSWLENIPYVDVYKQDELFINDQYSDSEDIYEDDDDDKEDDDDDDSKDEFNAANSDDDDYLAAKLERCFLGNDDEDHDNEGEEDGEHYNYDECNQFFGGFSRHTSYKNYMERVLKELSDT